MKLLIRGQHLKSLSINVRLNILLWENYKPDNVTEIWLFSSAEKQIIKRIYVFTSLRSQIRFHLLLFKQFMNQSK